MRRTLPSILTALVFCGLLTAAVIASPDAPPPERRAPAGSPLGLMAEHPQDLDPRFDSFRPPPRKNAGPGPTQPVASTEQLAPLGSLAPDTTKPSRALGQPWKGRLVNGVMLPAHGASFFTFDSALRRSPSREWRRYATSTTIARTLAVLDAFHAAHPDGPRIGVGDLSRPRGGSFGAEYGGLGHNSHQNGRDVDVYFPRRDGRERPSRKPSQVDRRLAQELVDRFVAAGAEMAFVGPSLGLKGPRGIVQPLPHHDDHVHVRWPRR